MEDAERELRIELLKDVIDVSWQAVNKSVIGPIITEATGERCPHEEGEEWRRGKDIKEQRVAILSMACYETYLTILESQLDKLNLTGENT